MSSLRLGGSLVSGFASDASEWKKPGKSNCGIANPSLRFLSRREAGWRSGDARRLRLYASKHGRLLAANKFVEERQSFSSIRCHACSYHEGDRSDSNELGLLGSVKEALYDLVGNPIRDPNARSVTTELTALALPAIVGQAVEPVALLMETAYIGGLGPVELASAGVSISIFNIISKLFNVPLLSITTSFVAEDIAKNTNVSLTSDSNSCEDTKEFGTSVAVEKRMQLPSVSSALLLASGIGIVEAVALYYGSRSFINLMGVSSASPMLSPAQNFLALRALGAPAVVISLAIQGVFRGFKDTKTPVLCIGAGNLSAVVLLPILIYYFNLGITGAALSTVASQYISCFMLIWLLNKRAVLLPPKLEDLEFGGYIKSGALLLGRTLSVLVTMTLGTSMAARQGPIAMAAHQICMQIWLAVSLLSDALALSAQALIASSFSNGNLKRVKEITFSVLKTGVVAGIGLAIILSASFGHMAKLFTKDIQVVEIVKSGILFVCASQPINALAFIFDGLHYGVSDFSYSAISMMVAGAISSSVLLYAPTKFGLPGVWSGLTMLMALRMLAGFWRLGSRSGPWWFLREDSQKLEAIGG